MVSDDGSEEGATWSTKMLSPALKSDGNGIAHEHLIITNH